MGRHLSPWYGQVILVSGYLVLTAVNWSQHWCAISFLLAPKVVRKCESKHWLSCGADGRRAGGRCTVTWLPNFLGWVDYLSYGATSTGALRANLATVCEMCLVARCPKTTFGGCVGYYAKSSNTCDLHFIITHDILIRKTCQQSWDLIWQQIITERISPTVKKKTQLF